MCYEVSDRDGEEKMKAGVYENEAFIKHALADDSDMVAGMSVFTRSLHVG